MTAAQPKRGIPRPTAPAARSRWPRSLAYIRLHGRHPARSGRRVRCTTGPWRICPGSRRSGHPVRGSCRSTICPRACFAAPWAKHDRPSGPVSLRPADGEHAEEAGPGGVCVLSPGRRRSQARGTSLQAPSPGGAIVGLPIRRATVMSYARLTPPRGRGLTALADGHNIARSLVPRHPRFALRRPLGRPHIGKRLTETR
jgi:hypothetical protein